jgi:glutaredoxin
MTKIKVEAYLKEGCSLCREAKKVIKKVSSDVPFAFKEIDITSSEDLFRIYKDDIPTVFINGKKSFKFKVDEEEFRKKIKKEIIKAKLSMLSNRKLHCDS